MFLMFYKKKETFLVLIKQVKRKLTSSTFTCLKIQYTFIMKGKHSPLRITRGEGGGRYGTENEGMSTEELGIPKTGWRSVLHQADKGWGYVKITTHGQ